MIIRTTPASIAAALAACVVMALGVDPAAFATSAVASRVAVNPQPLPPGVARFDEAVYAPGGCARVVLHDMGLKSPRVTAYVVGGTRRDRETITLFAKGGGEFTPKGCLPIGTGRVVDGDGTLEVSPGQAIYATLVASGDRLVGGAIATIAGTPVQHRLRIVVTPSIEPATLQAQHVGALVDPEGRRAMFAEDHVVLEDEHDRDLQTILERTGGRLLNSLTLPASDAAGPARMYRAIGVAGARVDTRDLAYLMTKIHLRGTWRVSSPAALRTLALVAQERATGMALSVDPLLESQSVPATQEANGQSAFAKKDWYDPTTTAGQAVRAAQAMSMADVFDTKPGVTVAFVDSGFASPADYGKQTTEPDFGTGFNNIPQCAFNPVGIDNCANQLQPNAAGPGQLPCGGLFNFNCPWHGTEMFSVAESAMDNGSGVAGIGSQAARPMFMKIGEPYALPAAAAIKKAVDGFPWGASFPKADVINLSSGYPCAPLLGFSFCGKQALIDAIGFACASGIFSALPWPVSAIVQSLGCGGLAVLFAVEAGEGALGGSIAYALQHDVVVDAAAGNDGKPVGYEDMRPCNDSGVICVGNLGQQASPVGAYSGSNFGPGVFIWAPGTSMPEMPLPNSFQSSDSGTSQATAFLSGVVALLRGQPKLTPNQVKLALASAACRTAHTVRVGGGNCTPAPAGDRADQVGGYLDVLDALQWARDLAGKPDLAPCTGGWDTTETGMGGGDQSPTSPNQFPGQPIPLNAAANIYPSSDLTIHALPQAGPADADWFSFTLAPPQQGQWKWWYGDATFQVPDTQYADLQVQVFAPNPNNPSNPTLIQPAFSQDSSQGMAWVRAPFGLGQTYLIKVSGVNPSDSNCYDNLTLRMLPDLKAPDPNSTPGP